jgi:hypothetical protein
MGQEQEALSEVTEPYRRFRPVKALSEELNIDITATDWERRMFRYDDRRGWRTAKGGAESFE